MKIPFDIKYRPQIESGEYKVETGTGKKVRIICWDKKSDKNKKKIVALLDDGNSEHTEYFTKNGTVYDKATAGGDLFIITPEPELSEFEKGCIRLYQDGRDDGFAGDNLSDENLKECSAKLLALAREQFIKDGYVIEKKAFHDAVEKVAPEVMKEVSDKVDMANEELTEFEKELESFYNHHLQVCTYDNQGTVEDSLHDGASRLLAIARKELCEELQAHEDHVDSFIGLAISSAYERGKAEALKDLPRWKKCDPNTIYNTKFNFVVNGVGRYIVLDGYMIDVDRLEKLPGFEEE